MAEITSEAAVLVIHSERGKWAMSRSQKGDLFQSLMIQSGSLREEDKIGKATPAFINKQRCNDEYHRSVLAVVSGNAGIK